jgi:hypothetical protein
MTTNISRLYDTNAKAQLVMADLKTAGIPDDDISLIANSGEGAESMPDAAEGAASGAGIGAAVGGGAGLLTGLGIMAIPGVGPIVAAGWIAATMTGLVAGAVTGAAAGGIVGALTDNGVDERDAHVYAEAIRRGGSLVLVRTDDERRMAVENVLDRHAPVALAERRTMYEGEGWKGFDAKSEPYARTDAGSVRSTRAM